MSPPPSQPDPPSFTPPRQKGIGDLPEEIIELILSYLLPYKDSASAASVCKLWNRIITAVNLKKRQLFRQAIENGRISWQCRRASVFTPGSSLPSPAATAGRHSNNDNAATHPRPSGVATLPCRLGQCAVCEGDSVIAFGGLSNTSVTSFNDLWRLDLDTMSWRKVISSGIPPLPRGNMTMIRYHDDLIIHGGRPGLCPPGSNMTCIFAIPAFHDTMRYSLSQNRWSVVDQSDLDSAVRSRLQRSHHSVCLLGDSMIMFGGLPSNNSNSNTAYNDVWSFDLETLKWTEVITTEKKPSNRFGQIQVNLDDIHVLILGGVELVIPGQFQPLQDMWLLKTDCRPWKWIQLEVMGETRSEPSELYNKDACVVGNSLILFDESKDSSLVSSKIPPANNNIPANRFSRRGCHARSPGGHFTPLGGPAIQMHVLNIGEAQLNRTVTWLTPIRPCRTGTVPPAIKVFSMVEARGELVLFGGYYSHPGSVPRANLPLNDIVYIVSAKTSNNIRSK